MRTTTKLSVLSVIIIIGLALLLWAFSATPALGANEYTVMSILWWNPGVSAAQMETYVAGTPLSGHAQMWIDAGNRYGIDPVFMMSLAGLESGWGTSEFARNEHNLYGWGAYDDGRPAKYFSSWEEGTDYVAREIASGYLAPGGWNYSYRCGPTVAGVFDPVPPHYPYATSPTEASSIVRIMNEFASTIPGYPYPPTYGIYDVTYKKIDVPNVMNTNTTYQAAIRVTNTGQFTWPQGGPNPVHLGYYWYSGGTHVMTGAERAVLPSDLAPGQSATLIVNVTPPASSGSYTLKFDLFHEEVTAFSGQWVPMVSETVTVYSRTIYNKNRIQTIPSSEMATYSPGSVLKARPGMLIKGNSDATVFVADLVSGTYTKRGLTLEAFNKFSYHWDDIMTISDADLVGYTGGDIVTQDSPRPNGSLIRTASSSSVYLLEGGQRRALSFASFVSHGFRWDRVVIISDSEMATYTEGQVLKTRPGTLLKGSTPSVYVTDFDGTNYLKRGITGAAFASLGYHWEDIVGVSDGELNGYTDGALVSDASSHPNGALIKTSSSSSVYLLEGGQRRLVSSYLYLEPYNAEYTTNESSLNIMVEGTTQAAPFSLKNAGSWTWESSGANQVFLSYQWINADTGQLVVSEGLKTSLPSNVSSGGEVNLSAQVQASAQVGTYLLKWDLIQGTTWLSSQGSPTENVLVEVRIPHPNGALVKEASSSSVYLLERGERKALSFASFVSHGFRWDRIETISSSEMATYSPGQALKVRPGTLLKGSNATVYVTDFDGTNYIKRGVTGAAFASLGYHWEDIVGVSDTELNGYTDGALVSDTSSHPNGALVKEASSSSVYLLEGGERRALSFASFVSHGFRWDRIQTISSPEMATYSPGQALKVRPGTLLKGSNATVYVTDFDGTNYLKRGVTGAAFASLGYHWEDIVGVSDGELSSYTSGTVLQ